MAQVIVWTDEEKAALVRESARLMHSGQAPNKTRALVLAMAVLPPERRRPIPGLMSGATAQAICAEMFRAVAALKRAEKAGNVAAPAQDVPSTAPKIYPSGRIYWSTDEQLVLAQEVAKLRLEQPSITDLHAIRHAQLALPEDRRRAHVQTGHAQMAMKALAPFVKRELARLKREAANDDAPVVATPVPAAPANGKAIEHAVLQAPPSSNPMPHPLAGVAAIRETLVDALAGIFSEALARAISDIAKGPDAPAAMADAPGVPHNPRMVNEGERLLRPSVLIAGLKGAQKGLIEVEFGRKLALRYYHADESKERLKEMADAADVSVAYTDFLSHSHTDIMQSRAKHFVVAAGGLTTLRSKLQQLVEAARIVRGDDPTH